MLAISHSDMRHSPPTLTVTKWYCSGNSAGVLLSGLNASLDRWNDPVRHAHQNQRIQ